jgi:eukaryotic-like serine/threonine-protein kinase
MELRDQLQSVLGGAYSVERELGGGGMSRVFAATETALGRKVVIKVVPIELGAGVNVDRFKREIVVAANLQHPHIVPVLTAGEMSGVPYYTMPFVDGESLRAQLARGPMPMPEVVNVLRDVAKALAYAHDHGVVHRDIKPDNVLMSGGSAAVIDFGIAKAISAARASDVDSSLTQVGTSIGTPTYMAPEQAAADPSTDHRADIYSFGCMAYELLSGRPPFDGLSPHKLLAAHMSERPQPVGDLRPDTPPLLADLVMHCLEKDPDARPQSAADVARLLDAVGTTSSQDAMPSMSWTGPGTLQRALLIYAVAFAAVVILAKAAAVGIGVPDWIMPSTIGLMALGLPIILATWYVQRVARRALFATPRATTTSSGAATHSTMATLAIKASPYLSWRRVTRTAISAMGSFALLVTVLMVLRPFGLGPFASLMAAGKLNDRDKILVADFSSTGSDTTLGPVISEAVRADLGQSPVLSIVTPQTVAATLQRMQLAPNTRVDTGVARQIAAREGIKAIVAGDVHSLPGGGFIVTMRLVSADSGQELASLKESAGGAKDLIPTIGGLTHQLRSKMGESLKHLQKSPELAQVTTASLPALEKYSAGQRALTVELNTDKAISLFKEAVEIDTGFASAYRALAVALGNSGRDRAGQIRYLEKAYADSARLPEVERYLSAAAYWNAGPKPDPSKALAAYEALLAIRPTHYAALNNAALIYASRRDFAKAEAYLRRSVASNPSALAGYGNLAVYQAEQGKLAAAESTFAAQLKVSGNNPRVALGAVNVAFTRGQYDVADRIMDSLAKVIPADASFDANRLGVHEATAMVRGKLADALRLSSQVAQIVVKRGSPTALLGASVDSAMIEAWYLDSKGKALALVQNGLQRTPLASLPPAERPYGGLAQIYALSGRPDLARAMLAEFEKNESAQSPEAHAASRHSIQGAIALGEHRYLDAVREMTASDVGACTTCALPVIAIAYDYAQQPDSAIAAFTRYVESPSIMGRFGEDGYFLAGSYKRLGELWEAKGDREKAARYLTKFVELWKDADPVLQPKVADARKRLAHLSDTETRR